VTLWEVPRANDRQNPRLLTKIEGNGALDSMCFTQDGSKMLVSGTERVIRSYDLESESGAQLVNTFGEGAAPPGKISGHVLKVVSLCAHPVNPNILFSGGFDRKVLIWDMRQKFPVGTILGTELSGDAMDINRDGTRLLTGSHRTKNPLQIHELRMCSDESSRPVTPGNDQHPAAGRRPSKQKASFSSNEWASYEWAADEEMFANGAKQTSCLVFSAAWDSWESKTIVAAGEKENLARVYSLQENPEEPLKVVGTYYGQDSAFLSAAITTDGRNAAFGSADGGILLVDVKPKG